LRYALAIACSLLGACTLLGLGERRAPVCMNDGACAALNAHHGIDPELACEVYQCDERLGACVRRAPDGDDDGLVALRCPGGTDCDDTMPAAGDTTAITGVADPAWLAWSDAAAGTLAIAYAHGGEAAFDTLSPGIAARAPTPAAFARDRMAGVVEGDEVLELGCWSAVSMPQAPPPEPPVGVIVGTTCETHAECQDGDVCNGWESCDPTSSDPELDARKCRPAERVLCDGADQTCDAANVACLELTPARCTFGELAVAPARDDELFAAAIDVSACPEGRLYAGWLSSGPADLALAQPGPNVLVHGDDQRAPGIGGIDVDASGCTGASREVGEPRGASSPAIASLPPDAIAGRRRPQALLAWSACPHGCAEPADIEVLGLVHEEAPWGGAGRAPTWVTPLNDARPVRLPTRSRTRAAMTAVRSSAPDCAGGVLCGYVLAYGAEGGGIALRYVQMLDEPEGIELRAPYATTLDAEARSTLPIDLGVEEIAGAMLADEIAIAAGPEAGMRVPLRALWTEGGRLFTAMIELDPASGAFELAEASEVGSAARAPHIVYAASGVCGPSCAGYALTWVSEGGAHLLRMDTAGAIVARDPIALGAETGEARAFADGDRIRVAWHAPLAQELVVGEPLCAPR
jgi:hypothetical protein